jgi:conjugal transfer pilus assembly protein TrbC
MMAAVLALAAGPLAAQDLDGPAIDQAVEDALPEVTSFAAEVAGRAEAYAAEARTLKDDVFGRGTLARELGIRGLAPFDLQDMSDGAEQGEKAQVYVFASLGMPDASLRPLIRDAAKADVPVLLRGFRGGSFAETAKSLRALLGEEGGSEPLGGVLIDPRAFAVFGIDQVPVFVAAAEALPQCRGLDCSVGAPAHDRVAGNMSLKAALRILAGEGASATQASGSALARLEEGP